MRVCVCVRVCVLVFFNTHRKRELVKREREREREREQCSSRSFIDLAVVLHHIVYMISILPVNISGTVDLHMNIGCR